MKNYYKALGLNTSATGDEIRRAYRVLARRYHPDVNPGRASEEKFKEIAEAYTILSDPGTRKKYDAEFERKSQQSASSTGPGRAQAAYARAAAEQARRQNSTGQQRRPHGEGFSRPKFESFGKIQPTSAEDSPNKHAVKEELQGFLSFASRLLKNKFLKPPAKKTEQPSPQTAARERPQPRPAEENTVRSASQVSIVELSVTIRDAIYGVRKTVEIEEAFGLRKISVVVPPGVKTGSVLRMRSKHDSSEELVVLVRVANHPFLSIQTRGLVAEIPITIGEAIRGTSLKIPTLDEPEMVKIPPATQSGSEIRLKGKGIPTRDGTRGDLFLRLMIRVPESSEAIGLREKAGELEMYYGSGIRENFPKTLLDL